ncbi:DUF3617 domain-containing protein [Sphingomonas sp. A2-49]|uniref:DUF3617 domain-containing protein n=1 Tax=Sphingomonas sp. A2-49 TaxID=1391375 RepID=UPI0021CF8759|nr:DUF3617 domain-containing protein [Sphingomonas sp. A2-49]MCU6455259.1 DUF3617 domain-containing protein [Sphingomonas sp. A2-49]
MRWLPILLFLLPSPGVAAAQAIAPGRWDVVSTAVDLTIPGAPGFLLRMMRGRSKTERKCVAPADAPAGVAALLAPDPKARCRIESQRIADGRYTQTLSCPQKKGDPMSIVRAGSYDADGFAGRLTMTGRTPKGALAITIDQKAKHVAGACRG